MYQPNVESDFSSFPTGSQGSNFTFAGDFTVEAWVYYTSASSGDTSLYVTSQDGSSYFALNISMTSGNYNIYLNSGATAIAHGITANTWTHVAMTISGTTIKIYINGTLNTTSATYTGVAAAGLNTTDLVGLEGSGTYFTGYLNDLRITKGVARYTSTFTPPTTAFTAK
jgi:ribosomal protein S11